MTEKLYDKDAYCKEFDAVVLSCMLKDGRYYVELNRTAFFPEGGGQAPDKGCIDGATVIDVQEENGVILHTLLTELPVGRTVHCIIDWELRYSRMQSHTGEHILSGIVNSMYGYDNVGFHMNDRIMLVDFNGSLLPDDIEKIELCANRAVYSNADVRAYYPTKEELEVLNYRSKKEIDGAIRIVSIGYDVDCCACCAPHVAKTGEIGVIKVLDFYSYKQGTRIEMTAGINAFMEYMRLNLANKELMQELSAPRESIVDAVRERSAAYQTLKAECHNYARRAALLALDLHEAGNYVYAIAEKLSFDELRYCVNSLIADRYEGAILFSKQDEDGYIYVVSSKVADVREIAKKLNESFLGKGGGQAAYCQGKITIKAKEDIIEFVEKSAC